MKNLFGLKLLPFLLLALLSFAPAPAHAAPPSDSMFNCLGDLDWGCRIIGFLFQTTDNQVTYVKNGTTVVDTPIPAVEALRGLMGFFSNALLVFASIKLLYELIQMVAESAHTGQVGGKNTNKLWAPIRLVVAIGLLVPLTSGLNSGQYIVLQMAKWGSGLASQGWKLFAEKLNENQTLSAPVTPRVLKVSQNVFKTAACMTFVNYYARMAIPELRDEVIDAKIDMTNGTKKEFFGNNVYKDVCGVIDYKLSSTPPSNLNNADLSAKLTNINQTEFNNANASIRNEASKYADAIINNSAKAPNTENFTRIEQTYQTSLQNALKNSNLNQDAMNRILSDVQNAAGIRGWTSAGTWFLAITRAQGEIITGGLNIPEASGPNEKVLCTDYKDACDDYKQFLKYFNDGQRPQDTRNLGVVPPGGETTVLKEESDLKGFYKFFANTGGVTIDALLGFLDGQAVAVGLWADDPAKAFGDLGGSRNPFGEIAALGHKKIRLALDYLGLAILTGGAGGLLSYLPVVGGAIGAVSSGAVALIMAIATLMMLAGVTLAFFVPLMPFTKFFFAILTWLGSLMEAMILVPFMALGHLTPNGEGFSGPNTKSAYFSIFQVFLRPILTIFGLIAAMILFYVAAKFINAMFYEATSGMGNYQDSGMKFIQKLVYSVAYVGLIYTASNVSFKMIEHIPQHALGWMGGSAKEQSYDDHQAYAGIAAAVGGQQLISQFNQIPNMITSPIKGVGDSIAGNRKQQIADQTTAAGTAATNRRHNEQMIANGGRLRDGMTMEQPNAVQMPTEQQRENIDKKDQEVNNDRNEATRLKGEIDDDIEAYTASGGTDTQLRGRIESKANRYTALTGENHPRPLPAGITAPVTPPISAIEQGEIELRELKRLR